MQAAQPVQQHGQTNAASVQADAVTSAPAANRHEDSTRKTENTSRIEEEGEDENITPTQKAEQPRLSVKMMWSCAAKSMHF
jgi:hypothetical protein